MHAAQLQELFDELSAALVLYARQWCESPDDAVQEAFIDLSTTEPKPVSPKAWLHTTTRRKAHNIARAEKRRRRHYQQVLEQNHGTSQPDDWFRHSDSTLPLAEDVRRGLETLRGDEREVVVARLWGELSFEQLAELLDCSVSSAHRRYTAALQRLKEILSADSDSIPDAADSVLDFTGRSGSPQAACTDDDARSHKHAAKEAHTVSKLGAQARLADGDA